MPFFSTFSYKKKLYSLHFLHLHSYDQLKFYMLSLQNLSILQNLHLWNLQDEKFSDDEDEEIPSAPPICGSAREIEEGAVRSPVSTKNNWNTLKTTSSVKVENDTGNRNPVRFVWSTIGFFLFRSHICKCVSAEYISHMRIILSLCALPHENLSFCDKLQTYN